MKEAIESRFPIVFGGFMGFALIAIIDYNTGATFPILIQNAAIGTVVGAFFGKIFLFLLASAVKSSTLEKERVTDQSQNNPKDSNNN